MAGIKPKGKVKIEWSPDFAYAIGLIASDGCVSQKGKHITFTSKDMEQIVNFQKCLQISVKIGVTVSGYKNSKAFRVQFGDVLFSRFLNNIGITPNKSKTIKKVDIPDQLFFDFLRGMFDGDGYTYSYWDKRWKSSFMFYLGFASGSKNYINWLQERISIFLHVKGHITGSGISPCYQLKYAKKEALVLFRAMYHSDHGTRLSRKKLKIDAALGIVGEQV